MPITKTPIGRFACNFCNAEVEWQERDWYCPNHADKLTHDHTFNGHLAPCDIHRLFLPGDVVTVSYTGYTTECLVIKKYDSGWWIVEELRNSLGDDYNYLEYETRPRYEVAEEFMVMRGEDPAPEPFSAESFALTRSLR